MINLKLSIILFDGVPVSIEKCIRTDDFRDSTTKKCSLNITFSDTSVVIKKYQHARANRPVSNLIEVKN